MSTPPSPGPWDDPRRWSQPPAAGPAPGGPPAAPMGEPEPPSTITTSALLMYVGAAIGVLGILWSFTMTDEIREQVVEDNPRLSDSEIDAAVNLGVAVAAVVGLVGVGLWIWMAIANRNGLSWARVVSTVLGGLNIGFTLLGLLAGSALGQTNDGVSIAMQIASVGLAAVILALLWQPQSTRFYDAVSAYKRQVSSPYGY